MSKIALKTAKRNTSITRDAVREAVNGIFTNRDTLIPAVKNGSKTGIQKSKKH